jgi:hypothetical protein
MAPAPVADRDEGERGGDGEEGELEEERVALPPADDYAQR